MRLGSVEDENRSRADTRHPATVQANGEADQRRTLDSALPLDHARRLIQRLVPGHVVAWSSHRHPATV